MKITGADYSAKDVKKGGGRKKKQNGLPGRPKLIARPRMKVHRADCGAKDVKKGRGGRKRNRSERAKNIHAKSHKFHRKVQLLEKIYIFF